MKKIILILALLSLGVSKAQVVGGYLPLNSSKSATIGAVRTNSLVVTASTISVGAKTLTAVNTGTVAVLSDALFGVNCQVSSSNPADATSYTCGIVPFSFTGFNTGKVYIPYNCTLVGWTFSAFTNGTPGSAESGSLSININGTSTQLSSAIITSVAVVEYSASGLSTSVTAGNYINAIYTTPTWATNPTSIALGITFWFVRRS